MLFFLSKIIKIYTVNKLTFKIRNTNKQNYKKLQRR